MILQCEITPVQKAIGVGRVFSPEYIDKINWVLLKLLMQERISTNITVTQSYRHQQELVIRIDTRDDPEPGTSIKLVVPIIYRVFSYLWERFRVHNLMVLTTDLPGYQGPGNWLHLPGDRCISRWGRSQFELAS